MPKQRRNIAFSLSFLDIMACGFGAVTLLFLIVRHNGTEIQNPDAKVAAELAMLKQDIKAAEQQRALLQNSLEDSTRELNEAQTASKRIAEKSKEFEVSKRENQEVIDRTATEVVELDLELDEMEDSNLDNSRSDGTGSRELLSGLKMSGERVLILVDGSASMLADNLAGVVLRITGTEEQRRESAKWKWTVNFVDWILTKLPIQSRFQIYIFNTEVTAVIKDTQNEWLDASDPRIKDLARNGLAAHVPELGTSLEKAFAAIREFEPLPDNIFLLTDGLPTQGAQAPKRNLVTAKERRKLYDKAVKALPRSIPVNSILFPMEGDPGAAKAYWELAAATQGAFLSPSTDWR